MKRRTVTIAAACLFAGGCALNAVRVETAKDFATASDETVTKTKAYFTQVVERRREANAALMASDPSCLPTRSPKSGRYVIRVRILSPSASSSGRIPLCLRPKETATDENSFELPLNSLGPDVMEPRLILLAAVADYGAALAKIGGRGNPDISKELTGIAEKLDDVGKLLDLAGANAPSAGDAIGSAKGKALIGLLQFAAELAHEQDQVDAIRKLDAEQGDKVDEGLLAIQEEIENFATIDHASFNQIGNAQFQDYRRRSATWDYQRRNAAALLIIRGEDDPAAADASAEKIKGAVVELRSAHRMLHDLLQPNPQLSAEMRRKLDAITRERLWRALNLIAAAASAFAGA